jgi:cell division protein FtsB
MILSGGDGSDRPLITRFLVVFLDSLLVVLLVGLYVFLNITGANNRLKLKDLERTKQDLEKRRTELRVNIEFLSSPEQLDVIARERFGMEPITGDRIYILRRPAPSAAPDEAKKK